MNVAAVLTAAGSGSRLGRDEPKAFVQIAGEPLVLHAARRLLAAEAEGDRVQQLVVTVPEGLVAQAGAALSELSGSIDLWVVEGGPTRQASVQAGLAALLPEIDMVLVHDAARAFASPAMISRVMAAVRSGHGAVIPGLSVIDTIKRVGPPDSSGARKVRDTPVRSDLVAVQTPQGFERSLLDRAHAFGEDRADSESTAASDDAGLVEALGEPVWVVLGEESAQKITTPSDLAHAERLVAR